MAYYSINSPRIIHENVDNEILIVDTLTGSYFSLEGAGSEIWQLIDQKYDQNEIVQHLSQNCKEDVNQVSKDLKIFLKDLLDNNLILHKEKSERALEPQQMPRKEMPYAQPKLKKFTDLQDLLLIDPIHDIRPNRAK